MSNLLVGNEVYALGLPCEEQCSEAGHGENGRGTREGIVPGKSKLQLIRMKRNFLGPQQVDTVRDNSERLYALNTNKKHSVILESSRKTWECWDDRTKAQQNIICWERNKSSHCMEAQAGFTDFEGYGNPDYSSNNMRILKSQENRMQQSESADIAFLGAGQDAVVVEGSHEPMDMILISGDIRIKELENRKSCHNLDMLEPIVYDILNRPVDSSCSVKYPPPFVDPLIAHLCEKIDCINDHVWFDPVVIFENVAFVYPVAMTPYTNRKVSKPPGRPRKAFDQPSTSNNPSHPPSCGLVEAQKTWETAKILGISTNDEKATLSALRKSKRLLILEGNTA